MKGIRVDPQHRTAHAEPGVTLGELDHETQAWGLATPLGVVSMTGIAGLTLGGGLGWLNGAYGLACDNLLAADVVTADGRLVTASDEANDDLYWGIRGGGGNFGVVTSFEYRLHPVSTVLAGGLTYPLAEAPDVLRFYDDFVKAAPDELSTAASLAIRPLGAARGHDRGVLLRAGRHRRNRSSGRCAPSARPIDDTIQPMPYRTLQAAPDAGFPFGQLPLLAVRIPPPPDRRGDPDHDALRRADALPATGVGLQHMHGVASRIHPSATAFAHRAEQFDFLISLAVARPDRHGSQHRMDPSLLRRHAASPRERRLRQQPRRRRRRPRPCRIRANYERLAALKAKYDPTNVFRMNHNIQPTPVAPNPDTNGCAVLLHRKRCAPTRRRSDSPALR